MILSLTFKLLDLCLILFDDLFDHLASNASVQALAVHQAVVLHLTHLDLGSLLDLHGFLAELEAAHGLFNLTVCRSHANNDCGF